MVAHKKLHESGSLLKNVVRTLDINNNDNYNESENNLISNSNTKSHDVNSNLNNNSNIENLTCGFCDIKFNSVFDLNIHIKSHFNGIFFLLNFFSIKIKDFIVSLQII